MRQLLGDPYIICATNFESSDIVSIVDFHVVGGVSFDGVPAYLVDAVWPNVTMIQCALCIVHAGICDW